MVKYVPFFAWAGIICGLICTAGLLMPGLYGFTVSLIAMLPGFLFSSLYVMLTTRHEIETPKINPGYVGMLLSSAPIILFIFFAISN
jgi:hypothetical protein